MDDFARRLTLSRDGDPSALDGLFARWRPLLWLQARRLLGPELSARVDPSDVVQESFTQACRDLNSFRGRTEGEWVAWLRQLVTGHAAKARRHHRAARRDAGLEGAPADSGVADSSLGPAAKAVDAEEALRLAAAIEGLPAAMREVVLRRVFHQEPFEALARELGCSPGAARVNWTRALRKLRQALQ